MDKNKKDTIKVITIIGVMILLGIILLSSLAKINEDNTYEREREREFSEIEFIVPKYFEKDEILYKDYSYKENSVYCDLSVINYDKRYYKSPDEILERFVSFTLADEVSGIQELDLSVKGKQLIIKGEDETNYYYSIESSNYYYLINYEITDYKNGDREDATTNKCITSREKIINTIKTY